MVQFEQRRRGYGIFYLATDKPDKLMAGFPVEASYHVILHFDGKSVIVHKIKKKFDGTFSGYVLGIEPAGAVITGIDTDAEVTFTEDQVISASKDD